MSIKYEDKKMSNTEDLKNYLLGTGTTKGYLLDDIHNGKTIMLSGAWGAGKTYFWKEEIERKQIEIEIDSEKENKYSEDEYKEGLNYLLQDKKKACVYISLYGKDNLEDIKKEILFKASTEKDYLSDDIEAFGFNALSTIDEVGGALAAIYNVGIKMKESHSEKKGTNKLKQGGVICFDDFERKSKEIDLNDLFGFISQLAISLKCKAVIILNSEVFKGKEKEIFTQVKEKTVSKYLFFNPSVEELFEIIFKEYTSLKVYEEKIKSTLKEVGIVNARIYNQVLDNIQEWIIPNRSLVGDGDIFRYFVLVNINFILTHHIVLAKLVSVDKNAVTSIMRTFSDEPRITPEYEDKISVEIKSSGLWYEKLDNYIKEEKDYNEKFIDNLIQTIRENEKKNTTQSGKYDNSEGLIEFINNNQSFVESLHFIYAFQLDSYGFSHNEAEVQIMNSINNFVETGIV